MCAVGPGSTTVALLERVAGGDRAALDELFARHRRALRLMVDLRLDPVLRRRVEPSDVVQEACLDAARRLQEFLDGSGLSFRLWLRLLTGQKLAELHRRHVQARARDVRREQAVALPPVSSERLALELSARGPTPSRLAAGKERLETLTEALSSMEPLDREVLVLRHFEELSHEEIAQLVGTTEEAVRKRYVRALRRLRRIMGGSEEAP